MSEPSPLLPHAASFASTESDLNTQHRRQVSAIIHTTAVGLKSTLNDMFQKLNLGATIGPRNDTSTPFLFEGYSTLVIRAKEALQIELTDKYPGVEVEWGDLVESSGPLSKVTLNETEPLKRQSPSGEFKEADLVDVAEELSVGASATTEMIKKVVKDTWSQLATSLGYFKEKHIVVTHKGVSHAFEISTKTTQDFHTELHQVFHLNAAIHCLFHLEADGTKVFATEIGQFEGGMKYQLDSVLNQDEVPPKFTPMSTDMETFFAILEEDQGLEPDDIKAIRAVFATQKIRFKQLMAVGDLAITDEKLEKDGIKERGLRTAILSVIRSNMG
ncbi:hypothetical protein CcCBS67573_g08445 [Chytriomyces confervae]|uniref:Uncharacterized protein n=1 Tax=Chytriomyces confervae TaxID=246404 RepID=A0A507ELX4_9FUNG|nr:hypothetical protein CcCBS67573_g08445 [Chytriomyces confervae]